LSRVGIVCALAAEARHLRPSNSRQDSIATLADGTLLAISGMGCVAAESAANSLLDAGATALASWGMAGGLDPALTAGAICVPDAIMATDGSSIVTARYWRTRLDAALSTHQAVVRGTLLTSTRAIASVEEKAALFRDTGAAEVDMESIAIARVAAARQLPFIAVRVVVDAATDVLPRTVKAAADGAGHLQIWRLIAALARMPADLAPLLRLARRYRAASRSLAAVARVGALPPYAFAQAPDAGTA
jgi:adenosylhomocysteine nucleosidase